MGGKMGTAEDKEVSRFSYSTSSSYLKNIESCSKPTSQVKDRREHILRASTGIRGNTEQISVESSTKQPPFDLCTCTCSMSRLADMSSVI
jgi:hypothetical protein